MTWSLGELAAWSSIFVDSYTFTSSAPHLGFGIFLRLVPAGWHGSTSSCLARGNALQAEARRCREGQEKDAHPGSVAPGCFCIRLLAWSIDIGHMSTPSTEHEWVLWRVVLIVRSMQPAHSSAWNMLTRCTGSQRSCTRIGRVRHDLVCTRYWRQATATNICNPCNHRKPGLENVHKSNHLLKYMVTINAMYTG